MKKASFTAVLLLMFFGAAGMAAAQEQERPCLIPEVTVTGKAVKPHLANLNYKGVRFPGASLVYERGISVADRIPGIPDGLEMGVTLKLKKRTWIRRVEFDILDNSFDTLKLELVICSLAEGARTPILPEPRYVAVAKSDRKQRLAIDLDPYRMPPVEMCTWLSK